MSPSTDVPGPCACVCGCREEVVRWWEELCLTCHAGSVMGEAHRLRTVEETDEEWRKGGQAMSAAFDDGIEKPVADGRWYRMSDESPYEADAESAYEEGAASRDAEVADLRAQLAKVRRECIEAKENHVNAL